MKTMYFVECAKGILIFSLIIIFSTNFAVAQINLSDLQYTVGERDIPASRSMLSDSHLEIAFLNRFCIKEMMYKSVEYNGIFNNGNLLFSKMTHEGYGKFGELTATVGYGRRFGDKTAVALCGVYLLNHAEHYPTRHSFTIDISLFYQVSSNISLSVSLFNPIHLCYGVIGDEPIPMCFLVNIGYRVGEASTGHIFCKKALPGELDIGIDLTYKPASYIFLYGICSMTRTGIGIHIPWKGFVFSLMTDWYYRVSFSPQCDIHYFFKNDKP